MANPIGQDELPAGIAHHPGAMDAVPSDWATTGYFLTIAPHPDDATRPILKWVPASEVGAGFIIEDGEFLTEDGNIISE
jgi:hypothetical protein